MGDDLRVGKAVFVAEQDNGFVPSRVDSAVLGIARFVPSAWDRERVGWLAEDGENVIGSEPPAIVPHVDQKAVFARAGREQLLFQTMKTAPVHSSDMDITKGSSTAFLHFPAPPSNEIVVEQGCDHDLGPGSDAQGPGPSRQIPDLDLDRFCLIEAKERLDVAVGADSSSLDFQETFAGEDL